MKRKNLVILCGIPGSGKSTWLRNHMEEGDVYVSRDEVRFSIINDDEEYFSHEDEVFNKFISEIEKSLNSNKRVFADATHINWTSRRKLIDRIHNKEDVDIDAYFFKVPLKICLERNEQRSGRACVPRSVIRRMHYQSKHPMTDDFKYHSIVEVDENGKCCKLF